VLPPAVGVPKRPRWSQPT